MRSSGSKGACLPELHPWKCRGGGVDIAARWPRLEGGLEKARQCSENGHDRGMMLLVQITANWLTTDLARVGPMQMHAGTGFSRAGCGPVCTVQHQ